MLQHEGHCYIFDKTSKSDHELLFWRCERKQVCKARLHSKHNDILKVVNEHSHEAAPHGLDYRTGASSLKNRIQVCFSLFKNIYCRRKGNTKLYKLKNYKPIYKYKYFSDNISA